MPRQVESTVAVGRSAEIHRRARVRDVDERRSRRAADERVLAPGHRIGPAPDVVSRPAADLSVRQKRHQIDVTARIGTGHAVGAGDADQGVELLERLGVRSLRASARAAPAVRVERDRFHARRRSAIQEEDREAECQQPGRVQRPTVDAELSMPQRSTAAPSTRSRRRRPRVSHAWLCPSGKTRKS